MVMKYFYSVVTKGLKAPPTPPPNYCVKQINMFTWLDCHTRASPIKSILFGLHSHYFTHANTTNLMKNTSTLKTDGGAFIL